MKSDSSVTSRGNKNICAGLCLSGCTGFARASSQFSLVAMETREVHSSGQLTPTGALMRKTASQDVELTDY